MNFLEKLVVQKEIVYMLNYLKKAAPSIIPAIGVLVSFLSPAVQAWAAAHPGTGATALVIWGILVHHLPSPVSK